MQGWSKPTHCASRQKQPSTVQPHLPEQQERVSFSQSTPRGMHRWPQGATQAVPLGLPSALQPQAALSALMQRLPATPKSPSHVASFSHDVQTP